MPVNSSGPQLVAGGLCLLLAALLAAAAAVWVWRRRRRTGAVPGPPTPGGGDPYAAVGTEELSRRANADLIEADNALRTSEQELGFAVAQYGTAATESFAAALAASRDDVAAAFRLRQRLDDAIPEDEPTRRQWLRAIIDRCAAADQRLDAEADAFDRLRAMQGQVETLLAQLVERLARLRARLPAARASGERLSARYADSALGAVAANIDQAAARIDYAGAELDRAGASLSTDRGAATLAVRGAEQSLGQAAVLLDGLEQAGAELDAARAALTSLLAETQAEVAAGRAALQAGSAGVDRVALAAAVARAEQILADVGAEMAAEVRLDPRSGIRRVEAVAAGLAQPLGAISDAASRTTRARSLLDPTIFATRSNIDAAVDFITTRRGAVGSEARTRLAEAQRYLDQAMASAAADPVGALAAAQRAHGLAEQAMTAARVDVERFLPPPPGGGFAGTAGNVVIGPGGGVSGVDGAILGGILIDGVFGRARGPRYHLAEDTGDRMPGAFGGPSTWARRTASRSGREAGKGTDPASADHH